MNEALNNLGGSTTFGGGSLSGAFSGAQRAIGHRAEAQRHEAAGNQAEANKHHVRTGLRTVGTVAGVVKHPKAQVVARVANVAADWHETAHEIAPDAMRFVDDKVVTGFEAAKKTTPGLAVASKGVGFLLDFGGKSGVGTPPKRSTSDVSKTVAGFGNRFFGPLTKPSGQQFAYAA